jgi:hypothetical protein
MRCSLASFKHILHVFHISTQCIINIVHLSLLSWEVGKVFNVIGVNSRITAAAEGSEQIYNALKLTFY